MKPKLLKLKNDVNSLQSIENIALERVKNSPLDKVLKEYASRKINRPKSTRE
jgi:hypothetical protein